MKRIFCFTKCKVYLSYWKFYFTFVLNFKINHHENELFISVQMENR
jgi:hypothetical protein